MKRSLALLLFCFPIGGETVEHRIQPDPAAHFTLYVAKTGLMSGRQHVLEFSRYDGTVRYDAQNPASSSVEFQVAADSLSVRDTWVSDGDRRKIHEFTLNDMLDASRHPRIRFVSEAAEAADDGNVRVTGSLTVRGIARPASVLVRLAEKGDGFAIYEGSSTIRMTDYGLKPPKAALGMIGTKEEMTLRFRLKAAAP
ncbi:MAG: YceI family protein [Bryobacterales bacterium]|nr:YceI family protein [Bryobacterales bacterium]